MEPTIPVYISISFLLFIVFLYIRASWNVSLDTNRGLIRSLFVLSWLSWLPMMILLLLIGMLWPAPYSEGAQQQEDWCYYQTLGHDGKTVYELETYYQDRVDLVLSDLISGKEQKRILIMGGGSASPETANMAWSGTTLAFLIEGTYESLLAAIKGDSVLFHDDIINDGWKNKSVSWDKAKKQWLFTTHFNDSNSRSYLKVKRYNEHFAALHNTDTLQRDDTNHIAHFYFMNGNWWGVSNLGWAGTRLYKASGNDSAILHFDVASNRQYGDTAWWIPGVPWSLHNEKAKYLASCLGIQKIRRPSDFDSLFRLEVSPYAEMRPDTAVFRFLWSDEGNLSLETSTLLSISIDTLSVTMRQRWYHYSLLHGRTDKEFSWFGKNDSLLQSVFVTGQCNGIFLKGDTLVVKGYGEGRRALFSVSTGKRLDHPGVIATYRWYLEYPKKSNWALLLPLLALLLLPLKPLIERLARKSSPVLRMRLQFFFALVYLCMSAAAWYILLDRLWME